MDDSIHLLTRSFISHLVGIVVNACFLIWLPPPSSAILRRAAKYQRKTRRMALFWTSEQYDSSPIGRFAKLAIRTNVRIPPSKLPIFSILGLM